jgi:dihydrofolate reductase
MKQDNHAVPECSVFVGVSLDGFIARPNGDLDWLMGDGGGDSAEYGYDEFIAGIDAIVMGRNTFEKVVMFDKWYYGNKRVVVLSHHSLDLAGARARGGVVEQM